MTCGEELIMFNERVLEFEGGAFIPCCKGTQPKNRTKIIEQQRFCHVWYRSRAVTATNALNEQSRRILVWNPRVQVRPTRAAKLAPDPSDDPFGALAKPEARA